MSLPISTSLLLIAGWSLLLWQGCQSTPSFEAQPILADSIFSAPFDAKPHIERSLTHLTSLTALNEHDQFPLTIEPGHASPTYTQPEVWTSGFFPGMLWLAAIYTGAPEWENQAAAWTLGLQAEAQNTSTHDLGFMLGLSAGYGWCITQDLTYLTLIKRASESLSSRFDSGIGAMKSWDRATWQYPVIIDNMMNLNIWLMMGDSLHVNQAKTHGDVTLKHHLQPTGRIFHLVDIDTTTHQVRAISTDQAYSDTSQWSRGLAWGIYGFTQLYAATKDASYLEAVVHMTQYYLSAVPSDMIPYWDFDDPAIPDAPRDASAAAIAAAGWLWLVEVLPDSIAHDRYLDAAKKSLQALSQPQYQAQDGFFTIAHANGNVQLNQWVDRPIIWADYYYLEALLQWERLTQLAQQHPNPIYIPRLHECGPVASPAPNGK